MSNNLEDKILGIAKDTTSEILKSSVPEITKLVIEAFKEKVDQPKKNTISITQCSREYGISRPTIYSLIKRGKLPSYQLDGSSKKYLKPEEIEQAFLRLPLLESISDYTSFETSIRKAVKRGAILNQYLDKFRGSNHGMSLSQFTSWLWDQGHAQWLLKSPIIHITI